MRYVAHGKAGAVVTLTMILATGFVWAAEQVESDLSIAKGPFQPTWDSLKKHQTPEWYEDAKFGIYAHWGGYCVPAYINEWYPRGIYIKGSAEYQHHLRTYGDPSMFGYKDFIPLFKAEKFDPEAWAELYARAGAKFAGPVAEHHDGFSMWASKVNRWNAKDMGPKRDVVGELLAAIRKRGLKTMVSFHHHYYVPGTMGPNGYYTLLEGSDVADARYADLYQKRPLEQEHKVWQRKIVEVVDSYQPDLVWMETLVDRVPETSRREALAHYYNRAAERNKAVVFTHKGNFGPLPVLDIERGRKDAASPEIWQTDDSISGGTWCYVQGFQMKPAGELIHELIDIVSKNGVLLLNVCPKADGTFPDEQKQLLYAIGDWLKVNGEAIYATRPREGDLWREGDSLRFTRSKDGKHVYAISLKWPGESLRLQTVRPREGSETRLLGFPEPLKWTWNASDKVLSIEIPPALQDENNRPCRHAYVIRIEGEPKPDLSAAPALVGEAPAPVAPPLSLWYRQPAQRWLDALPVGNGRVGAMVFGGVEREQLALNEVTLWSGAASDQHENPAAREAFTKIRELCWSGRRNQADSLVPNLLGRELNYGTNLPAGDLLIHQTGINGEIRDYRRELDLDRAVAKVAFTAGGVRFTREVLASHPQGVLAMRMTADRPCMLSFSLGYCGGSLPCKQRTQGDNTLVVDGRAFGPHSDGKSGVAFQVMFRVLPEGGAVRAGEDALTVTGASAATVLVAINTDFRGRDPAGLCARQIAATQEKGWPGLLAEHVADHQRLFRRVALDLGGEQAASRPTDVRLESVRKGQADPQLAALFFQYGRYLVIAGSREDSPLPMHLQGIWNDNLACNMGWTCDFHLDINTQQNYWPTEVCNLSECGEPLFRLVESLREPGRRTARTTYGIDRGWVCHVFTNAWGFTAPGWGGGWGLHVTGGVWVATHLWEHYQFTGDREFLARRAYPVLKGAAEFFLAYLKRDPATGLLYTGPSVSPEMGRETALGPTHDRAMVYELFSACIEASRVLGVDEDFRARLEAARAKLPPYRIGRNGQLQEWEQDDGGETNHRHTSHLVGLFPLAQITPRTTPALAKAASRSLELRMGRNDWEDVEWSRANAINYYARLLDGDKAEASVMELIRKLAGKDLLTISVSGIAGAATDIFCIDGNCAGTAGIAEMLLQSHDRTQDGRFILDLLPALPKAWPTGKISGLRARGGFQVDLAWKDGRLSQARVHRRAGSGRAILRYGSKTFEVNLKPGGTTSWEPAS